MFLYSIKLSGSSFSNQVLYEKGLGKTINVVTATYANPKNYFNGSSIFDMDAFNSLNLVRQEINVNELNRIEGTSLNTYYSQLGYSFSDQSTVSGQYKIFNGTLITNFATSISTIEYQRVGQYYHSQSFKVNKFSAALPNYLDGIHTYHSKLSDLFLYNLGKLESGQITYQEFFEMYGTHLIAEAVFGGTMEVNYSITDSVKHINTGLSATLGEIVNLGIVGLEEYAATRKASVDFAKIRSTITSDTVIRFNAYSTGGNEFVLGTQGIFTDKFNSWYTSINDSPVIIGYGNNGLVPLWKLIPVSYPNVRFNMESMYNQYVISYNLSNPFTRSISTDDILIRSVSKTIDDGGRFNQHYDLVPLTSSGYDYSTLYNKGVRNVRLIISLSIKELDDCFQHVYIYKSTSTSATKLGEAKFEHYPGVTNGTFREYQFILNLSLAELSNSFIIRYGASGNFGSDEWVNKDVKVSYLFY